MWTLSRGLIHYLEGVMLRAHAEGTEPLSHIRPTGGKTHEMHRIRSYDERSADGEHRFPRADPILDSAARKRSLPVEMGECAGVRIHYDTAQNPRRHRLDGIANSGALRADYCQE
jgi:hypothetical protein